MPGVQGFGFRLAFVDGFIGSYAGSALDLAAMSVCVCVLFCSLRFSHYCLPEECVKLPVFQLSKCRF